MVLLFANLALVLAFAVLVLATIRLRSLPAYLLAAYIVAYSDVILILEFAGLMGALGRPLTLALQIALTAGSFFLWVRDGRTALFGIFSSLTPTKLAVSWRPGLRPLLLGLLALLVGGVYLWHVRLILGVPPNNYDALTYHLSRVGYWLQYHSLYPWPTPNLRQTTFPMNAELGVLWTILWSGNDRLSGFVQWIAVPAIMVGIYGLVRHLGYSRWRGAVAALLWATLTQVLLQSSTTQNDLVTASFWVATLYFLFAGLGTRSAVLLAFSGMAFGLAIGTKGTSLIVLPALGVALLAVWWLGRQQSDVPRHLIRWAVACLLGFVVLGSYIYVQNTIAFGNPLGPTTLRTGSTVFQPKGGIATYADRLRDNLARYAYQVVDFSPLPFSLASRINPLKAELFSAVFQALRISVNNPETTAPAAQAVGFGPGYINLLNEDRAWFGPLAVVLAVAVIVQAYIGARRRDALRFALVIICLGFLVLQSAAELWTPYRGRYYMIPVAAAFPLMAGFLNTRTLWRAAVTCFLLLVGVTAMLTVTLQESALQPLTWGDTFSGARSVPGWANEFDYRMIMENVPANSSIGIASYEDFRDYPFFGEHFTRHVALEVPDNKTLWPRVDIGHYEADYQHSDYLFFAAGAWPSIPDLVYQGFYPLSNHNANSLWIRKDLRAPNECDGDKWPFPDFFRSSNDAAVCPRFPIVPGLASGGSPELLVPNGHFVPVVGSGEAGRLAFDLLVREQGQFDLLIAVDPGKFDRPEVLELRLSQADSEPQVYTASFRQATVLDFGMPLRPDIYTLQIGLRGGPLEVRVLNIKMTGP